MKTLRVLAVDDHKLMLEAIKVALDAADDVDLVGVAHSGSEALPLVGRLNPDVVLLDIRMPRMDGLTTLAHIRKRHPDVKVVMLSAIEEPEHIQAALRQGASSFVVKHIDPRDLASAIRQAASGAVFQKLGTDETSEEAAAKETGITESELKVLKALAQGLSNKQIAKELFVTEQTVKFHLTNIYRKLQVSNRTEAARYAYQHGLATNPFYEIA
jgi:DNA-binding NarL/FixJ family response regulator